MTAAHPGRPSLRYFSADAIARLRAPLAPTIVAILIALAATAALFGTTGMAVASQQATIDRINSPEGRLIVVSDGQGAGSLSAMSVDAIRQLSGVEWAVGVGPATDVRNAALPGGHAVTSRALYGSLPAPLERIGDRPLSLGEALAAPRTTSALGLADGVGAIAGRSGGAIVVDGFVADRPLERLADDVLVVSDPSAANARLAALYVSVRDVAHLAPTALAIRGVVISSDPGSVQIETSVELAQLSADVTEGLAESARWTLLALLIAVSVLMGALQFGRVASLSRDIGRSRALGASRSTIVVQMLLNAGLCAAIGSVGGALVGLLVCLVVAGSAPGATFTGSVVALVVLAALLGAAPPGVRASRLDPVRILRVP